MVSEQFVVLADHASQEITLRSLRLSNSVRSLMTQLEADPLRRSVPFTPEMAAAHSALFGPDANEASRIETVRTWLQRHQPCLFGRIAAKSDFLSYCVLDETDLQQTDEHIHQKIQDARLDWTRLAFEGSKSGFIIMVFSESLTTARPSETIKALACRLASLYLQVDVVPDQVFVDEIWLEKPGRERTTWKWNAGVNYFAANGDGRWWRDHRLPGGIAFSINSVGHMVKSGILSKAMKELEVALSAPSEGWETSKIDSLAKAHEVAMRTIHMASEGISGKATFLFRAPTTTEGEIVPGPLKGLPEFLADKNQSEYFGFYHTDYTVPSEYFLPDVERPTHIKGHVLDFTYLSAAGIDNPDHITMGQGRPIRETEGIAKSIPNSDVRVNKMVESEVPLEYAPRLSAALTRRSQD